MTGLRCDALTANAAVRLAEFIARHPRLLVLTGAGCSTESGIPDYRDRDGNWKAGNPVMYQDFVSHASARRRYWSRSMHGWPRFAAALPGAAHRALAQLEDYGRVGQLLTQNVDGLHQQAGHRAVVELHGSLATVLCLSCRARFERSAIQQCLVRDNPEFASRSAGSQLADGDSVLPTPPPEDFCVPDCPQCGGILKPDVVFFGESTPPDRVDRGMACTADCDALLVVGSSLMLLSGLRYCRRAATLGKAIALLNIGRTRADPLAVLKLEAPCGATLNSVIALL